MRVVGKTGSLIACVLVAVWGGGCAEMMDSYRPTSKPSDPVTIDVMYFSPTLGPDNRGVKAVYLVKQVRREHALGDTYQAYLCRVSVDGNRRKEIARLNSAQFPENLVTPGMTMMPTVDISWKARKAAIGVDNVALGGIWVLNLDGMDFHSLEPPEWQSEWKGYRASQPPRMSQPLWSADGEWLVFQETHFDRFHDVSRSVRCRPNSTGYAVLSTNDTDSQGTFLQKNDGVQRVILKNGEVKISNLDGSVSTTLLTNVSRQARYKDLENEKFRW